MANGTSLGGIPADTEPFVPLVGLVEHVTWDDAPALEKAIETVGAGRVTAFFCEPVIGAGGVYPPPEGYLAAVREICRRLPPSGRSAAGMTSCSSPTR